MLKTRFEKHGATYSMRCLFACAGDVLPMHKHQPAHFHDIAVISGSVKVSGPGWPSAITISAGDSVTLDYEKAREHQIEALESGTETVNAYRESHAHFERYVASGWVDRP